MRTISAPARSALLAQETGEVLVVLIAVGIGQLATPIRVCNAGVTVTSGGNDYLHCPFEIVLADDSETPTTARLSIDNVDRSVLAAIRSYEGDELTVRISVVLASSPNTIEAGPYDLTLGTISFDAGTIEGTLRYEDVLNEAFPAHSMGPSLFPGLF